MTRREKLLTAAVLAVNLTVGAVLAARADLSELLGVDAAEREPVAALTPTR